MADVVPLRRVSPDTALRIRSWLDTSQPADEAKAEAFVLLGLVARDLGLLVDVFPVTEEMGEHYSRVTVEERRVGLTSALRLVKEAPELPKSGDASGDTRRSTKKAR